MRPELDGNRIQEVLGIRPGREVGEAYRFLLDLRLDEGVLDEAEAEAGCASGGPHRPDPAPSRSRDSNGTPRLHRALLSRRPVAVSRRGRAGDLDWTHAPRRRSEHHAIAVVASTRSLARRPPAC